MSITVNPINDPPVAVDDAALVAEGDFVDIPVLANDIDPDDGIDPASVAVVLAPGSGAATVLPGGVIRYAHDGSETTSDLFSYQVRDLSGALSGPATVSVTVLPVNDPPVAVDDAGVVDQGQAVIVPLTANDFDPDDGLDPGSVTVQSGPIYGAVTVNGDGSVTYTHDGSPSSADAFTYTVRDLSGAQSNTATVDIQILPVAGSWLYAVRETDDTLVQIDPNTLAITPIGPLGVQFDFGELAWDPSTATLYMADGRAQNALYTVDRVTGAATLVGIHGITDLFAIEFDGSGTLWGLDSGRNLYIIDKTTGVATATGAVASTGSSLSLAWDSARGMMTAEYYIGYIYEIDLNTGLMTDLGNPSPIYFNNNGATYDPVRDVIWTIGWSGNITQFDPNAGYQQTELATGLGAYDGLAWVPYLAGSFRVNDGPSWTTVPPTYTCREACAMLFGGFAGDYACSTTPGAIDRQAYTSTYGVGGCNVYPDDYKVDVTYDSTGDVSAYVTDNCTFPPNTNYCFR